MPAKAPKVELSLTKAEVEARLMTVDGEWIAAILRDWGAPPTTAGHAANEIMVYLVGALTPGGVGRLQ